MQRNAANAPWAETHQPGKPEGRPSNLKLLTIVAAILLLAIGLIIVQPGGGSTSYADAERTIAPSGTSATVQDTAAAQRPERVEVTRSDTSLLSVPGAQARNEGQKVSRQLRQPIRLTDTNAARHDLRSLAATVLAGFGHATRREDVLHGLLVQALAEGQSDAYIDALLNTAAGRGEFKVPFALQSASGRLDTPALLQALIVQSGS